MQLRVVTGSFLKIHSITLEIFLSLRINTSKKIIHVITETPMNHNFYLDKYRKSSLTDTWYTLLVPPIFECIPGDIF